MKISNQLNFLIVDTSELIRQGISYIITKHFKNANIYDTNEIKRIQPNLGINQFDLIILGETLSNNCRLLDQLKNIKAQVPNIKILVLSSDEESVFALRYLNAGANGYITKDTSIDELLKAINKILTNGKYTSKELNEKVIENFLFKRKNNPFESLSDREHQITNLLIEGYSNSEISDKLFLKRTTVSAYKARIFEKTGTNNLYKLMQVFTLNEKTI